jgi:hypothetical protein
VMAIKTKSRSISNFKVFLFKITTFVPSKIQIENLAVKYC